MKTEKSEYAEYENSYWWCPNCNEELSGCRVTYQEKCDTCGHAVVWVENKDMDELERLAEIGRATEKAFEGIYSELLIHDVWPSGDNKGTERIASVEELLEWYKSQEDTDESL